MAVEIINWEEAMQQCGDDEEFLRELLADLRQETETQVGKIAATIQNPCDAPYHTIMRAAHVIKGASANLMCHQLRVASMNLEQAASIAHDAGPALTPAQQQAVQQYSLDLQQAGINYANYLQSIGV